jgi:hypothetical protein
MCDLADRSPQGKFTRAARSMPNIPSGSNAIVKVSTSLCISSMAKLDRSPPNVRIVTGEFTRKAVVYSP